MSVVEWAMRYASTAAMFVAATLITPAVAGSDGPGGTWLTGERDSRIRVSPCGKAFCATILWAKENGLDGNNPNPALRGRRIIGIELTRDMRPDGRGGWAGSMYNPDNGKTYQATMRRKGERELEVGGCVLGGLICGSELWSRQGDDTASVAPATR